MTKQRSSGNAKSSEFKGGDFNKYTAQSYTIKNGNEVFGGKPTLFCFRNYLTTKSFLSCAYYFWPMAYLFLIKFFSHSLCSIVSKCLGKLFAHKQLCRPVSVVSKGMAEIKISVQSNASMGDYFDFMYSKNPIHMPTALHKWRLDH